MGVVSRFQFFCLPVFYSTPRASSPVFLPSFRHTALPPSKCGAGVAGAARRRVQLTTVLLQPPSGHHPGRRQARHDHIHQISFRLAIAQADARPSVPLLSFHPLPSFFRLFLHFPTAPQPSLRRHRPLPVGSIPVFIALFHTRHSVGTLAAQDNDVMEQCPVLHTVISGDEEEDEYNTIQYQPLQVLSIYRKSALIT